MFVRKNGREAVRPALHSKWGSRGWKLGALAAILVPAVLIPGIAGAEKLMGSVTGFEHLVNPVWSEAKDPARRGYSFRELVPTVPAKYRKLFPHIPKELCLVAIAKEAQKPQAATLIRVGGGRTTPVTIVVTPGTKLVFQNTDPFTHRLYGVDVKEFAPNDSLKGAQREWTVPRAGTFEIRDELAPSLRMWVVAEPNVAAITYPSIKGEFALTVPASGTYDVQAYFAGQKVGSPIPAEAAGKDLKLQPIVVATPKKTDDKAD